ncbi:NUDIX domain-containing protein [Nocardiopsis mangrovi]|uniref:NUDIX domain-containing protein n=1 Tax=Nocardiopsis mangrovi TaxID=1179818 RepID=A0ABV9E019_9ACTN
MTAPQPPAAAEPAMSAAAIVPGPEWTLTFVLRSSGIHAGHWLLPRGTISPEESAEQAARRAAESDAGVRTGVLAPTGIYEVHGSGGADDEPYHVHLHVYRALRPCAVPDGFTGDPAEVAGIDQAHPQRVLPHPVDMLVLNDAGLADYDPDLVRRLLNADGVTVTRVDL